MIQATLAKRIGSGDIPRRLSALGEELVVEKSAHGQLRSYLESGNAPRWGMGISVLDGFLTGVACSPEKIDATQWLPSVWGELPPEDSIFRSLWPNNDPVDQRMHEVAMEQVLARQNEIVQLLESDVSTVEPIFSEQTEGHGRAEKWCFGFMEAIQLRPDSWSDMMESPEGNYLLFPITAHLRDRRGEPVLAITEEERDAVLERAAVEIQHVVPLIYSYWKRLRPWERGD